MGVRYLMYFGIWLALGAFATLLTTYWLVIQPRERVYFTAGMSGLAWLTMAYTAPSVQKMTETGQAAAYEIGLTVQFFVGLLGILSLLVVILYRLGEYPPPEDAIEA